MGMPGAIDFLYSAMDYAITQRLHNISVKYWWEVFADMMHHKYLVASATYLAFLIIYSQATLSLANDFELHLQSAQKKLESKNPGAAIRELTQAAIILEGRQFDRVNPNLPKSLGRFEIEEVKKTPPDGNLTETYLTAIYRDTNTLSTIKLTLLLDYQPASPWGKSICESTPQFGALDRQGAINSGSEVLALDMFRAQVSQSEKGQLSIKICLNRGYLTLSSDDTIGKEEFTALAAKIDLKSLNGISGEYIGADLGSFPSHSNTTFEDDLKSAKRAAANGYVGLAIEKLQLAAALLIENFENLITAIIPEKMREFKRDGSARDMGLNGLSDTMIVASYKDAKSNRAVDLNLTFDFHNTKPHGQSCIGSPYTNTWITLMPGTEKIINDHKAIVRTYNAQDNRGPITETSLAICLKNADLTLRGRGSMSAEALSRVASTIDLKAIEDLTKELD